MKIKYTKELMEEAVKNSFSYAEVCRKIGLKPIGSNYKTVKTKIELYNLDISHFTGQRWNKGGIPIEKILVEDSTYSCSLLRKKLIEEKIKEPKCERCGCEDLMMLELHHKNRNHNDNRLENLEMLCASCHTKEHRENDHLYPKYKRKKEKIERNHHAVCEYCGKEFYNERLDKPKRFCSRECYIEYCKQLRESNNITKETLIKLTDKYSTIQEIADELGSTRTTIRKYLVEYDLYDKFKLKYEFHAKIVEQYDLDLNLIKVWPSVNDAANSLSINLGSISNCALGKSRSAGGFIWRYRN